MPAPYLLFCPSAGSEEACVQLAELQPVAPVQSPELQAMGLRMEMDAATGKMKVVRDPNAPAAAAAAAAAAGAPSV